MLPNNRVVFLFLILLLSLSTICADDNEKEEEPIVSIIEEWRETLHYGIDSEIVTLIDAIEDARAVSLNEDLIEIYYETQNTALGIKLLKYFTKNKLSGAEDRTIEFIESYEDRSPDLILEGIRYLIEIKYTQSDLSIYEPLIEYEDEVIASSAIRALGALGGNKEEKTLIEYLEDDETEDTIRGYLILALGEMKSKKAVPILTELLEDTETDAQLRRYACDSLGKIGEKESFEVIVSIYSDSDSLLRAYATTAISKFNDDEVDKILIEALKDSFWRVRVAAAQGLADRKSTVAVPILIYKARKDPEKNVQLKAISSLSEIGSDESWIFLREHAENKSVADVYRLTVLSELIQKDLSGSFKTIEKIIAEEWEKEKSSLLDYICKHLSQAASDDLETIYLKMLDHPSVNIQIYGLRGIRINDIGSARDKVQPMAEGKYHKAVKREALATIEKLDG
jgi:hypothetical protein